MQKILFPMMAFVLTMSAHGQVETVDTSQFVAVYDYECRTQNYEGQNVTDCMQVVVQVGQNVTKSMPLSVYHQIDGFSKSDVATAYQEAYMHIPTVWTGLPNGKTTVREFIFPHEYEGSETTPVINWLLKADTITINGYLCQQASATFRGVSWHVYYSEEIPSSAGPWRLCGLPGLIVKAESEAHTFCIAELRQEISPITGPVQNPDVQRTNYEKLIKHRNEIYGNNQYAKNPLYYIADKNGHTLSLSDYINHMDVINYGGKQYLLADGRPLLTRAHVYQPLEK